MKIFRSIFLVKLIFALRLIVCLVSKVNSSTSSCSLCEWYRFYLRLLRFSPSNRFASLCGRRDKISPWSWLSITSTRLSSLPMRALAARLSLRREKLGDNEWLNLLEYLVANISFQMLAYEPQQCVLHTSVDGLFVFIQCIPIKWESIDDQL